jgi:hypothetical protein
MAGETFTPVGVSCTDGLYRQGTTICWTLTLALTQTQYLLGKHHKTPFNARGRTTHPGKDVGRRRLALLIALPGIGREWQSRHAQQITPPETHPQWWFSHASFPSKRAEALPNRHFMTKMASIRIHHAHFLPCQAQQAVARALGPPLLTCCLVARSALQGTRGDKVDAALVLQINGAAPRKRPVLEALDVLPAPRTAAALNAINQRLCLREAPVCATDYVTSKANVYEALRIGARAEEQWSNGQRYPGAEY